MNLREKLERELDIILALKEFIERILEIEEEDPEVIEKEIPLEVPEKPKLKLKNITVHKKKKKKDSDPLKGESTLYSTTSPELIKRLLTKEPQNLTSLTNKAVNLKITTSKTRVGLYTGLSKTLIKLREHPPEWFAAEQKKQKWYYKLK